MDRVLSQLLAQVLGELVEGNPEEIVRVGLWKGHICLENVNLRKSLFDDEKAPVSLCHGSIGKIEIKIPFNNFGNEPVSVQIEDINILLRPMYERDNMDMRLQRDHRVKRTKLAGAELLAAAPRPQKKKSASKGFFDYYTKYFVEKIAHSVLSNIHISITNFHLRYEDHVSCSTDFCFGVTLEQFSLHSVKGEDELEELVSGRAGAFANGAFSLLNSLISNAKGEHVQQACAVDSFAVYCNMLDQFSTDPSVQPFIGRPAGELLNLMRTTIPTRRQRAAAIVESPYRPRHDYILRPLHMSSSIDIYLGGSGVGSVQVGVQAVCSEVAVCVVERQLKTILAMADTAQTFAAVDRFSIYRPTVIPKENPAAWWRFAIYAVRLQLGHFDRPKFREEVVNQHLENKLVYTELWKRCVINGDKRSPISRQRFSSNSLAATRFSMLSSSKERRLYRRARCEGQMDVKCPLPYKKLSATGFALMIYIEERITFETIFFFRCLAELELFHETRDSEVSLLQQASAMFWEGVTANDGLPPGQLEEDKLAGALVILDASRPEAKLEGKKKGSANKKRVSDDSTAPMDIVFKLSHTIERVSLTLLLDPPSTSAAYLGGSRPAPIPFLGVVSDDIRVVVGFDSNSVDRNGDAEATFQFTLQDLQVLELLPAADNASGISGSVRSQAASVWSQFRRNKSRKIVSRFLKAPVREGVLVTNSSPFAPKELHTESVDNERSIQPLLCVKVEVPVPMRSIDDNSEAVPKINLKFEELEMYISPSCQAWVDALVVFATRATPPQEVLKGVPKPARVENEQQQTAESDVKIILDDVVESFDGFDLPFQFEGCLMPLRIVISDHVDGNDAVGMFDDGDSLDSSSFLGGEGHAVLIIDTGKVDIKVGQELKVGSSAKSLLSSASSISTSLANEISIRTSDIRIYIAEYLYPCSWRYVDPYMVERGSIVNQFSMQINLQVESKLLETIANPPFSTETDNNDVLVLPTPIVSLNIVATDVQMVVSQGKLVKLLNLAESFVVQYQNAFSEMTSGSASTGVQYGTPGVPVFQDAFKTSVLSRALPSDQDLYFDSLANDASDSVDAETRSENLKTAARSDKPNLDYDDDDGDGSDSDFYSVDDNDGMHLLGDDGSTINDLEVSVNRLKDEIEELDTERIALMANIRILELTKGPTKKNEYEHAVERMSQIDRSLKQLRRDYVESVMELNAVKELNDPKKSSQSSTNGMTKTVSYEGVATFLRGLGDSAIKDRTVLEMERERVREMHQLKKVMVAFHAVSMRKNKAHVKRKLWRRSSQALLTLNVNFPNIIVDLTGTPSKQYSTVPSLSTLAYGEEDIIMRMHTRDVTLSCIHRSVDGAARLAIREVAVVNFASQDLNCRELFSDELYEEYALRLHAIQPSSTNGVMSPRFKQAPNALKFSYDVTYGGNMVRLSEEEETNTHKIFTTIATLESTVHQDLVVKLMVCGKSLASEVALKTFLPSQAGPPSPNHRKQKRVSNTITPSSNGFELYSVAREVSVFSTKNCTFDLKFAGITGRLPLCGSDSLDFNVLGLAFSLQSEHDVISYEGKVGNICAKHIKHSDTYGEQSIVLFGKDFDTSQNIFSLNGRLGTFDFAASPGPLLVCDSSVEISSVAAVVSPATVVDIIKSFEQGPLLKCVVDMSSTPKSSSSGLISAYPSPPSPSVEQVPHNFLFPEEESLRDEFDNGSDEDIGDDINQTPPSVRVNRPLDMLIGVLDSSRVRLMCKTGSMRCLLTPNDYTSDFMEYDLCFGVLGSETTVEWGYDSSDDENEFNGMEIDMLVKGVHGILSVMPEYFLMPFDVANVIAILPERHGARGMWRKAPRQHILTHLPHKLVDRVTANSVHFATYISPIVLALDEITSLEIGKWGGSKMHCVKDMMQVMTSIGQMFGSKNGKDREPRSEGTDHKSHKQSKVSDENTAQSHLDIAVISTLHLAEVCTYLGLRDIAKLSSGDRKLSNVLSRNTSSSPTPGFSIPAAGHTQSYSSTSARQESSPGGARNIERKRSVSSGSGTENPVWDLAIHYLCKFQCMNVRVNTKVQFDKEPTKINLLPDAVSTVTIQSVACQLVSDDDAWTQNGSRASLLDCLFISLNDHDDFHSHVLRSVTSLSRYGELKSSTKVNHLNFVVNADILVLLTRLGIMYGTSAYRGFSTSVQAAGGKSVLIGAISDTDGSALNYATEYKDNEPSVQLPMNRSMSNMDERGDVEPASDDGSFGLSAWLVITREAFMLPHPLIALKITVSIKSGGVWIPAGSSCRGLESGPDMRAIFVGHDMQLTSSHNDIEWDKFSSGTNDDISPINTVWFSDLVISNIQCFECANIDDECVGARTASPLQRKQMIRPFSVRMFHTIYLEKRDNVSLCNRTIHDALVILQNFTIEGEAVHLSAYLNYHTLMDVSGTSFLPLQDIASMINEAFKGEQEKGVKRESVDTTTKNIGVSQMPLTESNDAESSNAGVKLSKSTSQQKSPKGARITCPGSIFDLMPYLLDACQDTSVTLGMQQAEVVVINDVIESPMPLFRVTGPELKMNLSLTRSLATKSDDSEDSGRQIDGEYTSGMDSIGWVMPDLELFGIIDDSPSIIPTTNSRESVTSVAWVGLGGRKIRVEVSWGDLVVEYNNNHSLSWSDIVRCEGGQAVVIAPLQGLEATCFMMSQFATLESVEELSREISIPNIRQLELLETLPSAVDVDACITKKMRVTIDKSALEVLNNIIDSLDSSLPRTSKRAVAGYSLLNQSGVPIMFRCHGHTDDSVELSADDGFTSVDTNSEKSLDVGLHNRSMGKFVTLLAQFPFTSTPSLVCRDLQLNNNAAYRVFSVSVNPKLFRGTEWNQGELNMASEVHIPVELSVSSTGLRKVLLRSTLCIRNTLPFAVQLKFGVISKADHLDSSSSFNTFQTCTLKKDAVFNVPVTLCAVLDLRVRVQPLVDDSISSGFVELLVPPFSDLIGQHADQNIKSRNRGLGEAKLSNDLTVKVVRSDTWRILGRDEHINSKCLGASFNVDKYGVDSGSYYHWIRFPTESGQSEPKQTEEAWRHMHVSVKGYGKSSCEGWTDDQVVNSRPNCMSREIALTPGINMLNGLPHRIEVLVYHGKPIAKSNSGVSAKDITRIFASNSRAIIVGIASGEIAPMLNFHCAEDVSFCIRIFSQSLVFANSEEMSSQEVASPWSNLMHFPGANATYKDLVEFEGELRVLSGNGSMLSINANMSDDRGLRSIELSVPYWIVTHSAHALHYQHHPKFDDYGLNGRDDLCADQCVDVSHDTTTTTTTIGGENTRVSPTSKKDKVPSFAGEAISSAFIHSEQDMADENWLEDERVGGKPYQLMMCGYSHRDEASGEIDTILRLRLEEFPWSSNLSLSQSASAGTVSLSAKSSSKNAGRSTASKLFGNIDPFGTPMVSDQITHFVVKTTQLQAPFNRTKMVMVMDKFIAINLIGQPIRIKQYGCNNTYELGNNDEVSLSWRIDKDSLLQMRLSAHNWQWSGRISFSPSSASNSTILLRQKGDSDSSVFLVEVSLVQKGGCSYIIFRASNFFAPYRIENKTPTAIRFHQIDCADRVTVLPPFHACSYAWEEPTLIRELIVEKNRSVPTATTIGSSDWLPLGKYAFENAKDSTTGNKVTTIRIGGASSGTSSPVEIRVDESGPTRILSVVDVGLARTSSPRVRSRNRLHSASPGLNAFDTSIQESGPSPLPINFKIKVSCVEVYVLDPIVTLARQELLFVEVIDIESTISLTSECKIVSIASTVSDVHVTGIMSPQSEVTMLCRSKDVDLPRPYIAIALDLNTQYPTGIVAISRLNVALAPAVINIDERMFSRLGLLATLVLHSPESPSNAWASYGLDAYSKDKKVLSSGFVRHNLHLVHHSLHFGHLEDNYVPTPSWADKAIVKTLIATKMRHPSATPSTKLYLQNMTVSDIAIDILANPLLLTSFPSQENGSSGGLKAVLSNLLFSCVALLRVMSNSVLKLGSLPLRVKGISIAKYFGDCESFGLVIGDRYTAALLSQTKAFVTSPAAVLSTASYLARFGAACAMTTVGNVAMIGQHFLFASGAVSITQHSAVNDRANLITNNDDPTILSRASVGGSTYDTSIVVAHGQAPYYPDSFLSGLIAGIVGLWRDPLNGARNYGMHGLLAGFMKSWVGLAAKPSYGLLNQIQSKSHSTAMTVLTPPVTRLIGKIAERIEYSHSSLALTSPVMLHATRRRAYHLFSSQCTLKSPIIGGDFTVAASPDKLSLWINHTASGIDIDEDSILYDHIIDANISPALLIAMLAYPIRIPPVEELAVDVQDTEDSGTDRTHRNSPQTQTVDHNSRRVIFTAPTVVARDGVDHTGGTNHHTPAEANIMEIIYVPSSTTEALSADSIEVVLQDKRQLVELLDVLASHCPAVSSKLFI